MTIAVTGATGQLGRLVIEALKTRAPAAPIVALARDPAKAAAPGVAARAFDYDRPETLGPALAGVEKLLLISSNEIGRRAVQHRNVIQAAKAAGVKLFAYTSLLHADVSPISLAVEHRQTEADIAAAGIPAVILRNGWYIENHTGSVKAALAGGAVIGSAGQGRISGAARADYAEAAAVVLTSEGQAGTVHELAGDEAFTLADLAAEISRQAGRTIPYRDLPAQDYAAALRGFGLPEVFATGLAAWDVDASRGALFDDGRVLSRLIGRPTQPLSAAVAAALA
jgi:NAD(P)H dehydrogenase (quinone)